MAVQVQGNARSSPRSSKRSIRYALGIPESEDGIVPRTTRTGPLSKRRRLRWNERAPQCINCGTNEQPRRARGFCSRCFPHAERLRIISLWDVNNPLSWKGSGYDQEQFANFFSPPSRDGLPGTRYLEAIREHSEAQLRSRRQLESRRRGEEPIDGLELEYLLRELATRLKVRNPNSRFRSWATPLDDALDVDGKRIIYSAIASLLDEQPRASFFPRAITIGWERERKARDRKGSSKTGPQAG